MSWGKETNLLISLSRLIWKTSGQYPPFEEGKKPSKLLMSMFMGFVDGDACIEIGPQKQYN